MNGTVPAGQIQLILDELATGEVCPDGHATQVVATVAATAVEYVPARQSVHTAEPVVFLYFPGTHSVHVPLGPV